VAAAAEAFPAALPDGEVIVRVLLTGASGFIGRPLSVALASAGHEVFAVVRDPSAALRCNPAGRYLHADYTTDFEPSVWAPRVAGMDTVVNAVGIFRERERQTYDAVHLRAPRALFSACAAAGVKVVQVSALGADAGASSPYHTSKRAADEFLLRVCERAVVAQPSIVFGPNGASARFFTTLASLPVIPLPGRGDALLQPIHIDDLVAALVKLVETDLFLRGRVPLVGPTAVTLRAFLEALHAAMEPGKPVRYCTIPWAAMNGLARIAALHPHGLITPASLGMLARGNTAGPGPTSRLLGASPRPAADFIAPREADAMRLAANLAWLLPVLRVAIAAVWIASGIFSLGIFPAAESYALLERAGLSGAALPLALYGAAALDLAIGIGILGMKRRRALWLGQIALILLYTAIITVRLPEFWLHPFGPVLKNLPMLAAIWMLYVLEERRWTT
jgi:uncharacterized protein YbjT (DUF2867 family)